MPRYKLTIEYDGTVFSGWQVQTNGPSVQAELRRAIEAFCGDVVLPKGAGRTDAGVHARGQVAHVDLSRHFPDRVVLGALNFHLRPAPVSILRCEAVSADFDARFSALSRSYLYHIVNRRSSLALDRDRAWLVACPLDERAMAEAATQLVGCHDFTTFRAAQCQAKSPIRTLGSLTVERMGEQIAIRTTARSFLHHQVRSMAGSLKLVGEGKWTSSDLRAALDAKDRAACGPVAPACGLYFMEAAYGPVSSACDPIP